MAITRLVSLDDAEALAAVLRDNREYLAPWEPVRHEEFYETSGQRDVLQVALGLYEAGTHLPHVILDGNDVVGRITLNGIVRGPFDSCSVGYFVAEPHTGRGVATAAMGEMKRIAFDEMRLHRIEAGTLEMNTASQRVLQSNGFERFGLAPRYLKIAGRWQDHVMWQVLSDS